MADPISIMAIAGLVYAGRKLSKPTETYISEGAPIEEENTNFNDRDITINDTYLGEASPLIEQTNFHKQEVGSFGDIASTQRSSGGEVLEMRDRFMYDGGRMNNLSPIERQNVGPGLGPIIGPNGDFSALPDISKWILTVGMILGRLELFAILVLFLPSFWRN